MLLYNGNNKGGIMKKFLNILLVFFAVGGLFTVLFFGIYGAVESTKTAIDENNTAAELPLPEKTGGLRGQLGIDKNINESNIDEYLGRDDSVYRDMRMLVDTASYEAIGGDSYLSGYVDGFEVVPYPKLIQTTGLPPEVGEAYSGNTLFSRQDDKIIANYKESMDFMEYYFPKDKNIFLMCGGGGYAGMTKELLTELGWDKNKIWVVGGYWYYEGEHNIQIKHDNNGVISYDFWKAPYHDIDFEYLNEK